MCLLRGISETLGKVQSVFSYSEVCFSPSVGSGPGNELFWGSALWKGKSFESISHCSPEPRHSPVLICPASQPKWCIGTQGLTSIRIKVSFEKRNVNGTPLLLTLHLPRDLKFIWPILFTSSFSGKFLHCLLSNTGWGLRSVEKYDSTTLSEV